MTAPSTTTQNDIDAIMDLAAPATDSGTPDASSAPETTNEPAQSNADGSTTDLYPNVLRTYKVGVDAPENGENPEGTVTVAEFAGYLTLENFKAGNMTIDSIVKDANIYTGVKASRQPLPVVLVFPADSDAQRDAKVYLPLVEATEVFRNRPERGSGNTNTSKRSQDEITTDGAKKLLALRAVEARLAKVTEQYRKVTEQMNKYHNWLRPYFKDVEVPATDPSDTRTPEELRNEAIENAVNEAFDKRAEELEVEADAAKNADISDNTTTSAE